jgi:hypothetical protein
MSCRPLQTVPDKGMLGINEHNIKNYGRPGRNTGACVENNLLASSRKNYFVKEGFFNGT